MSTPMQNKMTLIFDDRRHKALATLAQRAGISKAAIVRQLIDHAANMTLGHRPTCANGGPCLCPTMHAPSLPGAYGPPAQHAEGLEHDPRTELPWTP